MGALSTLALVGDETRAELLSDVAVLRGQVARTWKRSPSMLRIARGELNRLARMVREAPFERLPVVARSIGDIRDRFITRAAEEE
jgi:hypothetical protein